MVLGCFSGDFWSMLGLLGDMFFSRLLVAANPHFWCQQRASRDGHLVFSSLTPK